MEAMKPLLLDLNRQALAEMLTQRGESAFRAGQVYDWLIRGADFDEMTNLSKDLRASLAASFTANSVRIENTYMSRIDDTVKFLYRLSDDNLIEGVLMRYHHGDTLCVSTQVGCRMGCSFCASTLEGRVRNLTAGEILGQVVAVNKYLRSGTEERRVHNIVLMGSGEPLDNYQSVISFLRLVNDPKGLNISLRNISLSTCGLVPQMYDLAKENLPVTLSVSLHAPNDVIRKQMMPIANAYSMEELLRAASNYIDKTGRRVVFEYALVNGLNASLAQADELARRLRGLRCHVNLIPVNAVKERDYQPPSRKLAEQFLMRLNSRHISATIRREMGSDIEGACGQLRRRVLSQNQT